MSCNYCGGRWRCKSNCECPECQDPYPGRQRKKSKEPAKDHWHDYRFREEWSYEISQGGHNYRVTVRSFDCVAGKPCNKPQIHNEERRRI